jgi:hypothetical protein
LSENPNKEIYIITKHDFDFFENNVRAAWISEVIGYVETIAEFNEIAKQRNKTDEKYEGYNGKTYPRYSYTKLSQLKRVKNENEKKTI